MKAKRKSEKGIEQVKVGGKVVRIFLEAVTWMGAGATPAASKFGKVLSSFCFLRGSPPQPSPVFPISSRRCPGRWAARKQATLSVGRSR